MHVQRATMEGNGVCFGYHSVFCCMLWFVANSYTWRHQVQFFLTQLRTENNELAYHIGIQVAVNTRGRGQMPSNPGAYNKILTCLQSNKRSPIHFPIAYFSFFEFVCRLDLLVGKSCMIEQQCNNDNNDASVANGKWQHAWICAHLQAMLRHFIISCAGWIYSLGNHAWR